MNELLTLLAKSAREDKDEGRIALIEALHGPITADAALTYRDLLAHAAALKRVLRIEQIEPGATMTVVSDRPLHQAVALIAGLCNGLVVNLLNPSLSHAALDKLCRHAEPALLLADCADGLPAIGGEVRRFGWRELFAGPNQTDDDLPNADGGGLLIYTSGTTGPSKGVLLRWAHIRANVWHTIEAFGYQRGWVSGSLLPRYHTFTLISDILPALFLGGRCVLTDTFELPHAGAIVSAFKRHGVRSYSAAPIILEALCALHALTDVLTLQHAVAGAAPLKERTRQLYAELFGHPIIPCYGLSETTCFATISPLAAIRAGSAGKPAGIEIRAVNEQGSPLPPDATGELAMRGPSVISKGYFRDTERSFAHAFTADGWFLTGDIGRIDADGYVYVTGRRKSMVIRGGEKIYLEEVDQCLAELPQVVDCSSIVHCEADRADRSLTFVVTRDGAPLPRTELDTHVRARLGQRHVTDRIYTVRQIPRTRTGKASQPELRALAERLDELGTEVEQ
jgi:acyl-coenzyme A synthetase/AMP-(fatty) acid ligase